MLLALALIAVTPRFHFVASEFHNAVYHVACLTREVSCSYSNYTNFWNEEMHVTPQDGARLQEWTAMITRLQNEAGQPAPAPLLPNYMSYYPQNRRRAAILAAAFDSRSSTEFRQRAAKLIGPPDARRLSEIAAHFEQRLHSSWIDSGRAITEKNAVTLRRNTENLGVRRLAGEMASFLEVQPPPDIFIHLIPGPYPKSRAASAVPVGNHFMIEMTERMETPGAAAVVLHELTHALYETIPSRRQHELLRSFVGSTEPAAQSMYSFFNEAIATATQLLLMERNGLTDDDPYTDPYIPTLARAALPLLRDSLAQKRTVSGVFADQYLTAARQELKDKGDSPKFRLGVTAVLASESLDAVKQTFYETFRPRFYVTDELEARTFENLNVVRLLTYNEASLFAAEIPEFERMKTTRGFVSSKPRGTKGIAIYLVGSDKRALIELVKRLAALEALPAAQGTLFSLE